MAFTAEVCGFEGGDKTGVTGLSVGSVGTTAVRSGTYGFSLSTLSGASNNFGVQIGKGIAGITGGHTHAAFGQFFYRMHQAPNVNNCMLCGYADLFYVSVNSDMSATMHVAGVGTTAVTLPSPSATLWYRVRMNQWTTALVASDSAFGTGFKHFNLVIDAYIGGVLQFTFTSVTLNAVNIGFTSIEPLTLGSLSSVGGAKPTWDLDFDDTIYVAASESDVASFVKWSTAGFTAAAPVFTYDTIQPVLITGQGTHDQFVPSGSYALVNEVPKGAGTIASNGLNTWTDYSHQSSGGQSIEAFTVRVNANSSIDTNHALTVDAVETTYFFRSAGGSDATSPFVTNTYPTVAFGLPLTGATFDALAFGVRNKDGATVITLRNIYVEALVGAPPVITELEITLDTTLGFSLTNAGVEINVPTPWQLERFDIGPRSEETS